MTKPWGGYFHYVGKLRNYYLSFKERINIDDLKKALLYTFVFGLVAHGYVFFNTNLSHDSLAAVHTSLTHGVTIGRYLRPLFTITRGTFVLPTLIGFLSLLFYGITAYFIIDSFGIKRKIYKIITCGILVTNYSVSMVNATYIHDADSYTLSLLLVVFGVWISVKNDNLLSNIICVALFVISLGIYQSYISIAIFSYLVFAFIDLSEHKDYKTVIKRLINRLLCVACAMVIYYVGYILLAKLIEIFFNRSITQGYNSPSNATNSLSFASIISKIEYGYSTELDWIIHPHIRYQLLIGIINIGVLIISLVLIIKYIMKVSKKNRILMIIVVLIMPIGINLITFIWGNSHDLTLYPLFVSYIFTLSLLERESSIKVNSKTLSNVVVILLSILLANNIIYSNECYLKKSMVYDSTQSIFTRIIDRVEQVEGYIPGETEVLFVGNIQKSNIYKQREGFYDGGTGMNTDLPTTYDGPLISYINYVLGYNMNIVALYNVNDIKENKEIMSMPPFPNKDSIKMIDGVVVVKLSNY